MNRFYLFSTWIVIFFILLTGLFLVASCFYIVQLYLLNRKNKRFKKQTHQTTTDERKRTYNQNLKLATKLEAKEVLASPKQLEQKFKRIKKTNCKYFKNILFLLNNYRASSIKDAFLVVLGIFYIRMASMMKSPSLDLIHS